MEMPIFLYINFSFNNKAFRFFFQNSDRYFNFRKFSKLFINIYKLNFILPPLLDKTIRLRYLLEYHIIERRVSGLNEGCKGF